MLNFNNIKSKLMYSDKVKNCFFIVQFITFNISIEAKLNY